MNRLDNVLGPENWWDEYVPSENSVLCRLTIRLPDGSTLTKCDAGGYAGHGRLGRRRQERLLRRLQARRASSSASPATSTATASRRSSRSGSPAAEPAAPAADTGSRPPRPPQQPPAPAPAATANGRRRATAAATSPRTGKALFAWTKEQEQRYEVGLLKYLNSWAKLQDFPGRMVDWDAEQVGLAYAEACRKLQSIQSASSEARGGPGQLNLAGCGLVFFGRSTPRGRGRDRVLGVFRRVPRIVVRKRFRHQPPGAFHRGRRPPIQAHLGEPSGSGTVPSRRRSAARRDARRARPRRGLPRSSARWYPPCLFEIDRSTQSEEGKVYQWVIEINPIADPYRDIGG